MTHHLGMDIRFYTALPREITLAPDGKTVHVRPPEELVGLRAKGVAPAVVADVALACGSRTPLSSTLRGAEFKVQLNVSNLVSQGATAGLYLLASESMEEVLYVGVNNTHVFVDTRRTSQNITTYQPSFRKVLPAPFPTPASGVVQLHVYLDETVVEAYVADCTCTSSGSSQGGSGGGTRLGDCDCVTSSKVALAITALGFPLRPNATYSGLFVTCSNTVVGAPTAADAEADAVATATATVWPINAAPVHCTPPTCTPPPPPPTPNPECPSQANEQLYMADCNASGVGAHFAMNSDGTLSPATNLSLCIAWTTAQSPRRIVLGPKSKYCLKMAPNASSGELTVLSGCNGQDTCPWPSGGGGGSGSQTCLDSACGNNHPGDCRGPELFACKGACCTCNQMWKLEHVSSNGNGGGGSSSSSRTRAYRSSSSNVVRIMNGVPGPLPSKPVPGCHRSQQCLAACSSV